MIAVVKMMTTVVVRLTVKEKEREKEVSIVGPVLQIVAIWDKPPVLE
jgi:hypothetical protein